MLVSVLEYRHFLTSDNYKSNQLTLHNSSLCFNQIQYCFVTECSVHTIIFSLEIVNVITSQVILGMNLLISEFRLKQSISKQDIMFIYSNTVSHEDLLSGIY